MTSPYRIRRAGPEDVLKLPRVEREAVSVFSEFREQLGLGPVVRVSSVETIRAAQEAERLWVAADGEDSPVGFAMVREIDGYAHLHQLNVLPDHTRKGLGAALLQTVCEWARECGYPGVTVFTFRGIPWNEPFYARHGFRVLQAEELTAGLAQIVEVERTRGVRMDRRVSMRLDLEYDR